MKINKLVDTDVSFVEDEIYGRWVKNDVEKNTQVIHDTLDKYFPHNKREEDATLRCLWCMVDRVYLDAYTGKGLSRLLKRKVKKR
jgi:hypothetical protein